MNDFSYRGDDLFCEDVPIHDIVSETGTPVYIYSRNTLENHFKVFDTAFSSIPHLTCFSVKSNSNLSVLKVLAGLGAGVDVVSGGEIFRALKAGIPSRKIVYSGVGKSRAEIEYALTSDILMFNVESAQELQLVAAVAAAAGKRARVALRVNPDVDPKTHPYISTGLKKNKFGIKIEDALKEYEKAVRDAHLEIIGVACHIGSQITQVSPFVDALGRVLEFTAALSNRDINIQYLDLGGGLGITYNDETPPPPEDYADAITREMKGRPFTLILEPGRVIAGNAGILVSRVLYTKKSGDKNFIIVDAGMNDLVRPSLYEAYHEVRAVRKKEGGRIVADIVGPICESGDFIARGREVADFVPDDCIAVMSAGAYGFTMASNYNSRPRVPEVLVNGAEHFVIRERETYDDLVKLESIPESL